MPCVFFFSLKECRFGARAIISGDLRPSGGSSEMEKSTAACSWNWCSLNLKGHVMFSGNWLNGFGFYNIRSGRFHSAHVYWGMCLPVVFTLTLLPCHTDEPGTKTTFCIAVCTTLPLLPSQRHYFGLQMEDLVCVSPPLQTRCFLCPRYNTDAWEPCDCTHWKDMRVQRDRLMFVPMFCHRKAGEERRHRLWTLSSSRRVCSAGWKIPSLCSCTRCGPDVDRCWEGRDHTLGLGRAPRWAMLKEMEAAVPSPHSKSAPSVQNILAKLYRDK